ncbi:MAG: T9SS type A sorting domain-containing protein [Flavobacterium sp.]|nr:T9SS type A sorting domain-containing protein [Flavobacterium sp.]
MKRNLFLIGLFFTAICARAQYSNGNLIVSYNNGTTSSGAYRTLFLQEYTTGTTGTPDSATKVGAALSTGRIVDDRRAAWEGSITTTSDGKYIVLVGRNAADGTAFGAARVAPLSVVRVSKTKAIEYTDFLASDLAFNNISTRSVASLNGNALFIGTAGSTLDTGVRLATFGNNATTTSYSLEQTRYLNIFNNEFISSGVQPTGPNTIISGVASTPGTAPTSTLLPLLTAPAANDNLLGIVLFDVDGVEPGNDLMYVAQRNTGINKYYKSAGVWNYISTTSPADAYVGGFIGFTAMIGRIENGKPVLYSIKSDGAAAPAGFKSTLYQTIDNTPRTGDWNILGGYPTHTVIATSDLASAQTFRGVTFAPTATLSTASFEKKAQNWSMYPNPSRGTLNIDSELSGSFNIYNLLGQKVQQFKVENGSNTISVDRLNSGTYFVEGVNATQKLIIQK